MIKKALKRRPFKTKLLAAIIVTSLCVVLLSTLSMAWLINSNFQSSLIENTKANLQILAYNLAPAVSFSDRDGANQLLQSLQTLEDVEHASIYLLEENNLLLLASYNRLGTHSPPQNISQFTAPVYSDNQLQLTLAIRLENEIIGYIYQYSKFHKIDNFQRQTLLVVIAIMLVSLLFTTVISFKFQRILVRPLEKLVDITESISLKKDYSIRLVNIGDDEFSQLSYSFNSMLEEIEQRYRRQKEVEEKIRKLNLGLADKIEERTHALADTNNDLKNTLSQLKESQNQLIEKEKMASLGALVAGIAHEINTPVGNGVTANSIIQECIKNLEVKFTQKNIGTKFLENIIEKIKEASQITSINLYRASELISSFKRIAIDQSNDNIGNIRLYAYINEILLSLKPSIKRGNHSVHLCCNEDIEIKCNAGLLSQMFTNLVLNSIIHGFEGIEAGKIDIVITVNGGNIEINYQDDGIGMNEDSIKKLFEPFYTTKRNSGGTGLGAHIIYNVINQGLHGTLEVKSDENQGLKYRILLPRTPPV